MTRLEAFEQAVAALLAECQKAERSDPYGYGYISTEVVRRICKTALDQP